MRMEVFRYCPTPTIATGLTTQGKIGSHEDRFLVSKTAMTLGTSLQVRHEPFNLQQPDFKVPKNSLKIPWALPDRVKAGRCHQFLVFLLVIREVDESERLKRCAEAIS